MSSQLLVTSATANTLGIANTGTNYVVLSAMMATADDILKGLTNRNPDGFLSSSHTERISGEFANEFVLTYTPIVGDPVITINGNTIDSDLYYTEADTGIVGFKDYDYDSWFVGWYPSHSSPLDFVNSPNWGTGFRNVSVTYTGGYGTGTAVPARLSQAAYDIVAFLWNKKQRDPGLQSKTLGDLSWTAKSGNEWQVFLDGIVSMYLTGTIIRHPIVFT
jgi:hypothetical protein